MARFSFEVHPRVGRDHKGNAERAPSMEESRGLRKKWIPAPVSPTSLVYIRGWQTTTHRPNGADFFVNKVLLEHSQVHLFTYCLWLLLCYNGRVV